MQSPPSSQLSYSDQLTFTKILTHESLYDEIWAQLKQEQKQLFGMCQSNKDYQVWKEKFKSRILQRNVVTYFALIRAVKSMLTGNDAIFNSEHAKYSGNQEPEQQTPALLETTGISNPYSHMLCFRLLKDSLLKVDYGLLILVEAELANLMFDVSIYDSGSQDQQRGRTMYLQGLQSPIFGNNLSMTHEELEVVGYSVHKIVIETQMALGVGMTTIPYHPSHSAKDELKPDLLTDRILTPRTINSTFTSQFQRQKMKALTQQLKKYPANIIPSLCHNFYGKTKQMNIKYPEKFHYFKHKEIQRFKKDVVFNSEQKQYHVPKFYEFLVGFAIRQKVEINKKILQNVKVLNQRLLNKFRQEVSNLRLNSFAAHLKNVLRTKDRFALYFTVLHLSNALKMMTYEQKSKKSFSQENKLMTIFSILQTVEYLTMEINAKEDEKQGVTLLQLSDFSLEMFLAVDQIFSHFLLNAYFVVFEASNKPRSFLYEYVRSYFYCLVVKLQKIRSVLIHADQNHLNMQFSQCWLNEWLGEKDAPLKKLSEVLFKFYAQKPFPDQIKNFSGLKSGNNHFEMFQSAKKLFQVQFDSIEYKKIEISREVVDQIKKQAQLLESFNLLNFVAIKCSIPQQTDDTSINQSNNFHYTEKFLQNLKKHDQTLIFKSNRLQEDSLQITITNFDGKGYSKKIVSNKMSENQRLQDEQIPDETFERPQSIDNYRLKINPNDISKLNLNKTSSLSNFYSKSQKQTPAKLRQINTLSFKESLKKGVQRLNLMNRDTQTLRNLSIRKYKRKQTKSRANIVPESNQCLDQAFSCPTYMEENSESLNFGQTYQQLPSQQKINLKQSDMSRILALERQIEDSRKQQQKLMSKIKKQQQTISSMLSSDKKKNEIARRITGLPPLQQSSDIFHIKDSISKQVHMIKIDGQSINQLHQNTENTGNTQKKKNLNIKETDSYDDNNHQSTPTQNKTKLKSRFNQSNDGSAKQIKTKFDSTDKKSLFNGGSDGKPKLTVTQRLTKGKGFQTTESEESSLHFFQFPIKIKKDLLKKKVLIVKDQLIEIGMITQFEKIIPSQKAIKQGNEQKVQKRYNQFKLKSSLYITPLVNLKKIELQITEPLWLQHEFQANKTKQDLKSGTQYISYVDFWLRDIQNQKYMKDLPELEVRVEIQGKSDQKQAKTDDKTYKFGLPLFINKFFMEEALDQAQMKQFSDALSSIDEQEVEMSVKLAREARDLEKYFLKLAHSPQSQIFTKLTFLNQQIYLCFGNPFNIQNNQSPSMVQSKHLTFRMVPGSQLRTSSKESVKGRRRNQLAENLLITSMFSLLTD